MFTGVAFTAAGTLAIRETDRLPVFNSQLMCHGSKPGAGEDVSWFETWSRRN